MKLHPSLNKRLLLYTSRLSKRTLLWKALPIIIGLIAFLWFLIRVIPKPQRASYPCMKIAYPLMSGFVIWLTSITGIALFSRLFILKLKTKEYILAGFAFITVFITIYVHQYITSTPLFAISETISPVHKSNQPFGVAQGIIPGRVAWAWNPDATNENCSNSLPDDGYFLEKNNNQDVIDGMMASAIKSISGETTLEKSWGDIFTYFNLKKGKGNIGYKNGENIFIKINLGCANWSTEADLSRDEDALGYAETSPQIVISILRQLVDSLKIPQNNIIIADPISHIYSDFYDILFKQFPGVIYGDRSPQNVKYGRTLLHPGKEPSIFYSDKGSVIEERSECIYSEMHNADYLINIAALKAHACAGITLTAKNHFGSITRSSARHLHKALIGERNDQPYRVDYGMYRVQVDLMGSHYLGQNTLLYIVDGLWGGTEATQTPVKWYMKPFSNDWPNSILLSQDQVALESVCFDFLRNEAEFGVPEWKNRPNMAQGVDDYLHQAASKEFWPKGVVYDPDNKGIPLESLGVHEHWDNPDNKNYSGNLGINGGIELFKIGTP